ncbi:DIX domain-containing protein [Ditylenchus destructor]|uniref:DIX domain-containing protein n=1 Tax=Ditylenchus destructor TaxID=166010 RepID=A0AAD4NH62_9BILA|nr:DIX domain-containing protein [Ditylenchus destructor]
MVAEGASTKVYYHLDDSTPYMSIVPVPAERITLADFKKVFTRRGYTYFCKEYDPDLRREVKVEITSDSQLLRRSGNGLIELFLLSQNSCTSTLIAGSSGTLPRASKNQSVFDFHDPESRLKKRRSSALALSSIVDEMDIGGGQRVSMVTNDLINERSISAEASSDVTTLISKRAGEHLADLYNSSDDPYNFENNDPSLSSSNHYRRLLPSTYTTEDAPSILQSRSHARQRRPRKQRYRKPYVPSTISSASESRSGYSYSLPRVDEIHLRLQDAPMGISVACQDGGIYISNIKPGSAADICGQLEIGDQIVQLEHTSFEKLSDKESIDEIRKAAMTKKTIKIYVAKRPRISDQRSDALSQMLESTMQMDVSLWVEATTKQENAEPVDIFSEAESTAKTRTDPLGNDLRTINANNLNGNTARTSIDEEVTSDEEKAAYMDRRNGMGPRLVPAVQNKRMQDALLQKENQQENLIEQHISEPLHTSMDPNVVLKQMVRPDSGLQIKNRKWLKIPVPMSFIGDEMVDWLLEHVNGFRDRKAARAYASVLLSSGYIKHVVNMTHFNEKCYYIFNDEIILERLRLEQQISRTTLLPGTMNRGESTTEVTYMSSPSSPFLNTGQQKTNGRHDQNGEQSLGNGHVVKIANNPRYVCAPSVPSQLPPRKFNNNNGDPGISSNDQQGTLVGPSKVAVVNASWPISPIAAPNLKVSYCGPISRDCESPAVTNDYASMIQGEINGGAQFDPSEAPTLKLKENKPPTENGNMCPLFMNSSVIPPAPQRSAPLPKQY